ncbi:MAG: signal peptide peptidase SppA [Phycisphaerae bacterium]|nr:signal peptide peptidase SppA [Phycisphaerae bacterium]
MKPVCKWLAIAALGLLMAVYPAQGQLDKALAREASKIAVFELKGPIIERPVDDTFSFGADKATSLKDLVARMKEARDDDEVDAVVVLVEGVSMGLAQIEELRQVMSQIRAVDKDIYVHVDGLSLGTLALLGEATKLSVVPTGDLWLAGIHVESPYVRGLLDKIGVTPDFLTCGEYKTAAEILMRKGPSPQAEEMTNWLLDGLYDAIVDMIAEGRGVPPAKVHEWIDDAPYTAEKAVRLGIIDQVQHRQTFVAGMRKRFGDEVKFVKNYGEKSGPEFDFSSPWWVFDFFKELMGGKEKKQKNAIAIVYVDGPISLGSEKPDPFGGSGGAKSTSIRKALDKAAEDDTIKAVVLRINSPGGSATASEIILNASKRVEAEKTLVVSMGNVAGSGGYYVACGADVIFADTSTITGSIGVVGGKLATTEMWNKIGITWKEYNRGKNAAILSSARVFNDEERARIQALMDEIYEVFKRHVMDVRGDHLTKEIEAIAGGRVYTGQQALELGLVDKIGTLDDAIKFAAEMADLDDYEIRVIPEPKNLMELVIEEFAGGGDDDEDSLSLSVGLGSWGQASPLLESALPLIRHMDPQRLDAVLSALMRVEMLKQEGVVLMMPEFVVHH